MRYITAKQVIRLTQLANKSANAARSHELISKRFYHEYEKVIGTGLESYHQKTGADDPLVDIVEYGRSKATPSEMAQMLYEIIEDNPRTRGKIKFK